VTEEEEDEAQVVAEKEAITYKMMRERTKMKLWRRTK
jgi:hypothetical protein